VREPALGVWHLALTGAARHLIGDLLDHPHAGRADRMPACLEATGEVYRYVAPNRRSTGAQQRDPLAARAQTEILVVDELGDREAVVTFDDIELAARLLDTGLGVGLCRSLARGMESEVIGVVVKDCLLYTSRCV